MSWKATAFVKTIMRYPDGTKLRAAEKLLLFVLADDHNESRGYAWPSQKTLAKNALLSDRQVRRILKKIISKGWPLKVEYQKISGKFEMGSSHYYFIFPDEVKMSSPKTKGADKSNKVRTQLCPGGEDTAMSREVAVNRHKEPPVKRVHKLNADTLSSLEQQEHQRKFLAAMKRLADEHDINVAIHAGSGPLD